MATATDASALVEFAVDRSTELYGYVTEGQKRILSQFLALNADAKRRFQSGDVAGMCRLLNEDSHVRLHAGVTDTLGHPLSKQGFLRRVLMQIEGCGGLR